MGIDFPLGRDDVAARGNFCTVDDKGLIVDRRAGRIATELSSKLCIMLSKIHIKGAEVFVRPVKEHRFLIVFRGKGLSASMEDTDPERTGVAPKPVKASTSEAGRTASIVTEFITKASKVLSSHQPANMLLMRGFSKIPELPRFNDVYKLKAVAIASYPMYKGLARLLGMSVIESGSSFQDAVTLARDNWSDFDYFFIHFKKTDAAGEDGDFIRKVRAIEEVDSGLPSILSLEPDVLAVTGDHSTPAIYQGHSWHSVPFLISSKWCRPSRITKFGEQQCSTGNIGTIKGLDIMPLIMAHGQRLTKYGA
jgi:2,3-bisphosphoglycerate-independent phosphoglycerate mutase